MFEWISECITISLKGINPLTEVQKTFKAYIIFFIKVKSYDWLKDATM